MFSRWFLQRSSLPQMDRNGEHRHYFRYQEKIWRGHAWSNTGAATRREQEKDCRIFHWRNISVGVQKVKKSGGGILTKFVGHGRTIKSVNKKSRICFLNSTEFLISCVHRMSTGLWKITFPAFGTGCWLFCLCCNHHQLVRRIGMADLLQILTKDWQSQQVTRLRQSPDMVAVIWMFDECRKYARYRRQQQDKLKMWFSFISATFTIRHQSSTKPRIPRSRLEQKKSHEKYLDRKASEKYVFHKKKMWWRFFFHPIRVCNLSVFFENTWNEQFI